MAELYRQKVTYLVLAPAEGAVEVHVVRRGRRATMRGPAEAGHYDGAATTAVFGSPPRDGRRVVRRQAVGEAARRGAGCVQDIKTVLRAQRDLVEVTRALRPVLNYKGA